MNRSRNEQGIFAAAAIAVIAVFMPWIKITAPFLGSVTAGPTDGADGFIVIGAIAATVALAWFNRKTGALVAAGATALLVAYKALDLIVSVSDANTEALIATSYQAGLFLAIAAVAALVFFAVKNRQASTPTPISPDVETEDVAAG